MTKVKICGITSLEDARDAVSAGADALGFVFADSPRRVTAERVGPIVRALPPFVTTVGVFMNATFDVVEAVLRETGLQIAQLHGQEEPDCCTSISRPVIKRIHIDEQSSVETLRVEFGRFDVAGFLLDPGGGSGRQFNWSRLAEVSADTSPALRVSARHLILAGGFDSANVANAITLLRPYAVDVCSGVEAEPGKKDAQKVKAFIRAVEEADAICPA